MTKPTLEPAESADLTPDGRKCYLAELLDPDDEEEDDFENPPDDPDEWRDECDDPAWEGFRD